MTDVKESLKHDFSRYLEGMSGKLAIPPGTPLHILNQPRYLDPSEKLAWLDVVLRRDMAEAAIGMKPDYSATMDWQFFPFRFPHGIAWTKFPALENPSYLLRRSHHAILHDMRSGDPLRPVSFTAETAFKECGTIFLHLGEHWTVADAANRLHAIAEFLALAPSARIILVDRDILQETTREELSSMYPSQAIRERFEYNYALNFRVIAGKALVRALEETLPSVSNEPEMTLVCGRTTSPRQRQAMLATRIASGSYRGFDSPILLQVLYRLRRTGGTTTVPEPGGTRPYLFEKDGEDFLWHASEHYPKAKLSRDDVMSAWSISGVRPVLADSGEDGLIRLTEAGNRFLDMLHPDLEDPASLCRWVGRELTEDDLIAMERWIITKFRKTKTRVNKIGRDIK